MKYKEFNVLCQISFVSLSGKKCAITGAPRPAHKGQAPLQNTPLQRLPFLVYYLPSGVPPVSGQFAMAIPDLDAPASVARSAAAGLLGTFLRLCLPGILIFSFTVAGAAQSFAQGQQEQSQSDPSVAEAARQERARKQTRQKKLKHVYTAEDLKRDQILTPEDRAQVEAKRHQPAPAGAQPAQDAIDAQSLPANAPLGDVARQLQRQKESQKLQRATQFPLPLSNAPALASPKPPVLAAPKPPSQPLRPPVIVIEPARPREFGPFRPPVKRSPFERPRMLPPAIATPRSIVPALPTPRVLPKPPADRVTPPPPTKANVVTVQPGDSLWKIAAQQLGNGLRWQELLAVNPAIQNPNHIEAGSQIVLPTSVSAHRSATKYTVRKGDSLWTIAQSQLGHATSWPCIAQANPAIPDANLILEGQVLLLPATCKR
jgi:nucleoid-associated protein YgaU